MLSISHFSWRVLIGIALALTASVGNSNHLSAAAKIDVDGKVVLANIEKHAASFRVAKVNKEVAPRKASVLSPKKYPIQIEIWNGKRGSAAWIPQQIEAAGIYVFRYQNGEWSLSRREPAAKTSTKSATNRPSTTVRRPTYRQPTNRGTMGTASRVVRRPGRVYRGGRFPVLYRVTGGLLSLYRFIRSEEDRDLIRDIIIGREIDREIERELWDRLDDMAVNLPAEERREFDRALGDLQDLDESDLKDLENASNDEWDQVRDEFGDQVSDNAWRDIESDYADIDVDTQPAEEIEALEDVGIDSLETDVDLGDLDGVDLGEGDLAQTLDDVDVGDLNGGIEDMDVGDLGIDVGGGAIANPLGDLAPGANGGFDYDQGGFDDYGNNMDGGDFGAEDFGTPEFGGGDFGGGDLGGGFDDFGGGGFDDFGGDDFGGGFDDF